MVAMTAATVMEILTEDPPDVQQVTAEATAVQKAAVTDIQTTATTAIQIEGVHSEEAVTEEVTAALRTEVTDSRKDVVAMATPREEATAAAKEETSGHPEEECLSISLTDLQEGLTAIQKEDLATLKEEASDRAEDVLSAIRTTEAVSEADRHLLAETTSTQAESHRLSQIHTNSAMPTSRI